MTMPTSEYPARSPLGERAKALAQELSMEQIAGLMLFSSHERAPEAGLTDAQRKYLKDDHLRNVLNAGANDLGGTLMNESITRAAGAVHGQELGPEAIAALIRGTGREPRQRTTLYGNPPAERLAAALVARPLQALVHFQKDRGRSKESGAPLSGAVSIT